MRENNNFSKIKYYFRRYGFFKTLKKILKRLLHIKENRKTNQEQYKIWISKNESLEELEKQRLYQFKKTPKISVVVPMYNTDEHFFEELINSLKNQTYDNFELCLADGSQNENPNFKSYISELGDKVKYKFLNYNGGISENTNKAIEMATGEFIGFLDHDDILSPDALYEIVKTINEDELVDFIYSDEDKIDENKERYEPYFKPDFSPETLECHNYITHFVVVKKDLLKEVGNLNSEFNGAQDFDFVLRATNKAKRIVHIPKILYHWRVHRDSTAYIADSKPYAYEAGTRVIQEYLKSNNKKATVEFGNDVPGVYKIKYEVIGNPKVSILIPNKDHIELLDNCINSILKLTTYDNYEIVIIENNSEKEETFKFYNEISKNEKVKILDYSKTLKSSELNKFNYSKLINYGVRKVDSDFILQLNNDTKILVPDWLELFIGYAQNKEIGAVGGRLYYADKTLQHAGIIVGLSGTAGNALMNLPYEKHAYFGTEAMTRNVSAVTGACLFARRELYEEVGYMDEENFKVAFNDVDFCLKLLKKGYRIVYNPYIELFHYESKSRGYEYSKEQEARFEKESNIFKEKWKKFLEKGDPYYNINFTRNTCNYDINIE